MQQYNSDKRNPRLGMFLVILAAVVFYGSIYALVEWLHS